MTTTPHGQAPDTLIDLIDTYAETRYRYGGIYNARTEAARNAVIEALSGVQALSAAPGDVLDEALRERDDAEDFIDALLDEVLGHERPEWSSSYGRADALNDVQERMTALHKPAVDKAWGRFQSAMAAPKQEAQEPVAWQGVHDQTDLYYTKPLQADVRPLYAAPQPALDCHHRPPCDECAAYDAQGGK